MLAWPSISCTWRRSAPPLTMCVAKLCRKVCGLMSAGAPDAAGVVLQQFPNPLAAEAKAAEESSTHLPAGDRLAANSPRSCSK